jgi:hypothetical protein
MVMQQLRYVIAVARTRNFSRAAEQCHVSQPSLSQQILKLPATRAAFHANHVRLKFSRPAPAPADCLESAA